MIKNIFFILSFVLISSANVSGQNVEFDQKIKLTPYIPERVLEINPTVRTILHNNLYNKMTQIITNSGLGSTDEYNRFVITTSIDVVRKDISQTTPPMHILEAVITFHIGDGINGILFSSLSKPIKGLGKSEAQAYLMAINTLELNSNDVNQFINGAKAKIIDYYDSTCESTLRFSKTKASNGFFDEALFDLMEIPIFAASCYDKAIEESIIIYKLKLQKDCQINLANARKEMSLGNWTEAIGLVQFYDPSLPCYNEALKLVNEIGLKKCTADITLAKGSIASRNYDDLGKHLSSASINASCKKEADIMISDLSTRISANEKRAFDLAYEKYNRDQKLKEQNLSLKKLEIQAIRDIGAAYAKGRTTSVIYNVRNW